MESLSKPHKKRQQTEDEIFCVSFPTCPYKIPKGKTKEDHKRHMNALRKHECKYHPRGTKKNQEKEKEDTEEEGKESTEEEGKDQASFDLVVIYRWCSPTGKEDGLRMAALLSYALRQRGIRVWRDLCDLKSGEDMKEAIKSVMKQTKQVIVILFPGALTRCKEEDDFFRFEISTALELNVTTHFLIFDTQNIDQLFFKIPQKDPFFRSLYEKMTHVLVKFVSLQSNFEQIVDELSTCSKQKEVNLHSQR